MHTLNRCAVLLWCALLGCTLLCVQADPSLDEIEQGNSLVFLEDDISSPSLDQLAENDDSLELEEQLGAEPRTEVETEDLLAQPPEYLEEEEEQQQEEMSKSCIDASDKDLTMWMFARTGGFKNDPLIRGYDEAHHKERKGFDEDLKAARQGLVKFSCQAEIRRKRGTNACRRGRGEQSTRLLTRVCARSCGCRSNRPKFCPDQCNGNCAFKKFNVLTKSCMASRKVMHAIKRVQITFVGNSSHPAWRLSKDCDIYKKGAAARFQKRSASKASAGRARIKSPWDGKKGRRKVRVDKWARGPKGRYALCGHDYIRYRGVVECPCALGRHNQPVSYAEARRMIMGRVALMYNDEQTTKIPYSRRMSKQIESVQVVAKLLKCWRARCKGTEVDKSGGDEWKPARKGRKRLLVDAGPPDVGDTLELGNGSGADLVDLLLQAGTKTAAGWDCG